ncbi:MAG: TraB/GumN family protein [Verrucomicrobiaceae bacterium]|nr:TraB/GumN family protein [Verrucomicrobiaceae bacterium]
MSRKILPVMFGLLVALASIKAEPAMWVIRDDDSTIYLIGTLHLLKHNAEWNSEKVKKTVGESTELWLEIAELDNQTAMRPLITTHGKDPNNPLSKKLNQEQRKKLAKIAATYSVPVATLEPMQPWLAAVVLAGMPLAKAGYDPQAGIDRMLKAQADAEGDKVRGFETVVQQVRMFADLPEAAQVAFLVEVLDDLEEGLELLDKLAKAWMDGDTATIQRIGVDEMKREAPVVYKKLLVDRNVVWSEKIVEILKGSGVQQIAVGAAHLAGPDSLQAQLEKRGIKVERY